MTRDMYTELAILRKQFRLIAAQDEEAGGNCLPTEIYKSMQRLAREGDVYTDGLLRSMKDSALLSEVELAEQIKETVRRLNQLTHLAERKGLDVRVSVETISHDSTSGARRDVNEVFASVYRRL